MFQESHLARVTGLISYLMPDGTNRYIPRGACLVERGADGNVDVIWGAKAQNLVALSFKAIAHAEETGCIVLLD